MVNFISYSRYFSTMVITILYYRYYCITTNIFSKRHFRYFYSIHSNTNIKVTIQITSAQNILSSLLLNIAYIISGIQAKNNQGLINPTNI
nr:MAG TPA: hypothetical protein [Bacteriophage sp.]